MATCLRGGKAYRRHLYAEAVSEVDGTKLGTIVCTACGKEQVKKIILDTGTDS